LSGVGGDVAAFSLGLMPRAAVGRTRAPPVSVSFQFIRTFTWDCSIGFHRPRPFPSTSVANSIAFPPDLPAVSSIASPPLCPPPKKKTETKKQRQKENVKYKKKKE